MGFPSAISEWEQKRASVPRIIDLMLATREATHVALDGPNGATIVRVPTGNAGSFDRHVPVATRERLYEDGCNVTQRIIQIPV